MQEVVRRGQRGEVMMKCRADGKVHVCVEGVLSTPAQTLKMRAQSMRSLLAALLLRQAPGFVPPPGQPSLSLSFENSPALTRYGSGLVPIRNLLTGVVERVRLEAAGEEVVCGAGHVSWRIEQDGEAGTAAAIELSPSGASDDAPLRALVAGDLCGEPDEARCTTSSWRGGAAVALRAMRPGSATLCARLANAIACAHVRVLSRLATAPAGLLRLPPSAHVRLRLFRAREVDGVEEEVAMPTASVIWLAANPRVLSVAMHHGRLDAVGGAGDSKVIAVDVGDRRDEAASPDVRHAHRCAGGESGAWRASIHDAGEDHCAHAGEEQMGSGIVRAAAVVAPVAAAIWLEPAAWPAWLLSDSDIDAGAIATAAAVAAVDRQSPPFPQAAPDDDYDGGAVAPRCASPLAVGGASARLPPSTFDEPAAPPSPRTLCPRALAADAAARWAAVAPALLRRFLPARDESCEAASGSANGDCGSEDAEAGGSVALTCDVFGARSACRRAASGAVTTTVVQGRSYELRAQLAAPDGGRMLLGTNVRFELSATCVGAADRSGKRVSRETTGENGSAVIFAITPGPPPTPRARRDAAMSDFQPDDLPLEPRQISCASDNDDQNSSVTWSAVTAAKIAVLATSPLHSGTQVRLDLRVESGRASLQPVSTPPGDCSRERGAHAEVSGAISHCSANSGILTLLMSLTPVRQRLSRTTWQAPPLAARLSLVVVAPLHLRWPQSRRRGGRGDARDIAVAMPATGLVAFSLIFADGVHLVFAVLDGAASGASGGCAAIVTPAGDVELRGSRGDVRLVAVQADAPENGILLRLLPRAPAALALARAPSGAQTPAGTPAVAVVVATALLAGGRVADLCALGDAALIWTIVNAVGTPHVLVLTGGADAVSHEGAAEAAGAIAALAGPGLQQAACGVAVLAGSPGDEADVTVSLKGVALPPSVLRLRF